MLLVLFELGPWTVDLVRAVARQGDRTERLTTRECDLLGFLHARAGVDVDRETLHREVWGFAPTVVSRAADSAMKRLRRKLELNPAAPIHLLTVQHVGYRLQLEARPGSAGFGRAAEMAALDAAVISPGLVVVHGPAGVGKSFLLESLRPLRPAWAVLTGPGELRASVASALGLENPEQLEEALAGAGSALLVVDAYEAADAEEDDWLRAVARGSLTVVVGSRRPLLGADRTLSLAPLAIADAVAVLRAHGRTVDDDESLTALAEALDRMPQALVLAARWLELLSPKEIQARWVAHPELQGGVDRALEGSWSLLDDDARRLLAAAAHFDAELPLDGLEAVAGGLSLAALRQLVDLGLLQPTEEGPGGRWFRLFGTVRSFVRGRAPLDDVAVERLTTWCVDLGRETLRDMARSDDRRFAVVVRVRGELARAQDSRSGDDGAWLAMALHRVALDAAGPHLALAELAADLAEGPETSALAQQLLGATRLMAGDWRGVAESSAWMHAQGGAMVSEGRLLDAATAASLKDWTRMESLATVVRDEAVLIGDDSLHARALLVLAMAARGLGELDRAVDAYRDAESLCGALHSSLLRRRLLSNRSVLELHRGELEDALTSLEEAAAICEMVGLRRSGALTSARMAVALCALGRPAEAADRAAEALELARWSISAGQRGDIHYRLASALLDLGENEGGRRHATRASLLFAEAGATDLWAAAEVLVAVALLWDGRADAARGRLREQAPWNRVSETWCFRRHVMLAMAAHALGDRPVWAAQLGLARGLSGSDPSSPTCLAMVRAAHGEGPIPEGEAIRAAFRGDDLVRKVATRWPVLEGI